MFTGIIESTAKILQKTDSGLVLARPAIFDDLKIGCSIAVSGACLSVTAFDDASMSFDVVPTTFQKTKLGSLNVGDIVNLERAIPAHGRLEGHIVLGHCEGVAKVLSFEKGILTVSVPEYLTPYIVLHGSITLDGVALTVSNIQGMTVTVAIIPHTQANTTLGFLVPGVTVNVESDIVGKYILKAHAPR